MNPKTLEKIQAEIQILKSLKLMIIMLNHSGDRFKFNHHQIMAMSQLTRPDVAVPTLAAAVTIMATLTAMITAIPTVPIPTQPTVLTIHSSHI